MRRMNTLKSMLLLGTAASLFAAPALAQQADESALEEIVVTARRVSESLQKTPVAVTAFSAKALELKGIQTIAELQQTVPNTTLQVSRGTNSTLTAYIRGIGQQDPLWGFEPGVGIYIDDVYIARPQGAVLDVLDIQNIEVLRGPQGTLYGKNTIGGALKYNTKRLTGEGNFFVEGRYGTYNQRDIKAGADVALLPEKIFFGLSVARLQRDGFGKFVEQAGKPDNYNKDILTARVKLDIHAADNLFISLAADATEDDSNAKGGHRLTKSLRTGKLPTKDEFDTQAGQSVENEVKTKGVSAHIDWTVNDSFSLKSITSARKGETYTNIDFDSTHLNSFDVPAVYDDKQFTQEFQGTVKTEVLTATGGLYYYNGKACGTFDVILGASGLSNFVGGCVKTKSYSAYANASFALGDKLHLNAGGRYTKDKKEAEMGNFIYLGTTPLVRGTLLVTRTNFPAAFPVKDNTESWGKFSPLLGLDFQVNDDVMMYASYRSGFKSGGFDMRANYASNPFAVDPFKPETVDTWEAGLKAQLWDNRIRLNTAVFYNNYKDMQLTVQRSTTATNFVSQVLNAGQARGKGFEIEAQAKLTDHFTLNGSVGYIDAYFKKVAAYNPVTQKVEDFSNLWSISNTPKWSANLGGTMTHKVGEWTAALTGDWAYRSHTQIFELPVPKLDQPGYSLFNLALAFTSPDDHWTVTLAGKNIFDKRYRIAGYNFPATFGPTGNVIATGLGGEDTVVAYYGDPATFTAGVKFKF